MKFNCVLSLKNSARKPLKIFVVLSLSTFGLVSCLSDDSITTGTHAQDRKETVDGSRGKMPFSRSKTIGLKTGRVVESLPAGSYRYLKIASKTGPSFWLATLGDGPDIGSLVDVKTFASRTDFFSKKLQRTFRTLFFGLCNETDEKNPERHKPKEKSVK